MKAGIYCTAKVIPDVAFEGKKYQETKIKAKPLKYSGEIRFEMIYISDFCLLNNIMQFS